MARAFEHVGCDHAGVAELVERRLRKQRNRIAHGSDATVGIDYEVTEAVLDGCVRVGLRAAIEWLIAQSSAVDLGEFRVWLGRPRGAMVSD